MNTANQGWKKNRRRFLFMGSTAGSEPIKCPGQIDTRFRQGGAKGGMLQVDDVDEGAISPSKCNKRKNGQ